MTNSKRPLFSVTKEDCDWQTFTVGGNGGSGKDTSNTGVRCVHRASGATGLGRDERSQLANRRLAFRRMATSTRFQNWLRLEASKALGTPTAEERVETAMDPRNLKIETQTRDGRWEVSK